MTSSMDRIRVKVHRKSLIVIPVEVRRKTRYIWRFTFRSYCWRWWNKINVPKVLEMPLEPTVKRL